MSVPQEFLMLKVPRPEARAKKPGIAARAIVEYLIFATVYSMRLKSVVWISSDEIDLVIEDGRETTCT